MKPKYSVLFRLIITTGMLAMLLSLTPPQAVLAAINTTYYHYDDYNNGVPSPIGYTTGQFNAGDTTYSEGEALPHKIVITGLSPNTTYGLWIMFYYYKAGTCGFDAITQYDETTRLLSLSPSPAPVGGIANGSLPSMNGHTGGSMYTVGATSGATVGSPTYMFPINGGPEAYFPVTFTTAAATTTVELYYGLRLALDNSCQNITDPGYPQPFQGAGSWPGGSLETQIMDDDANINPIPGVTMVSKSNNIKLAPGGVFVTLFTGYKWNDLNGNAVDDSEPKLEGWTFDLYLCTTGGAACTSSTLVGTSVTNATGYYFGGASAPVLNNYYYVCEQLQIGWTPTFPDTTQPTYCSGVVQYTSIFLSQTRNFGNWQRYDWGDLPDPNYPTLAASNGACHNTFFDYTNDRQPETFGTTPAIWLGAYVDNKTAPNIEFDGQQSPGANGDDNSLSPDDEDGITLTSLFEQLRYGTMNVSLSSSAPLSSKTSTLVVWFDWNEDGDFLDLDETNSYSFNNWTGNIVNQSLTFYFPNYASLPTNLFFRARLFEGTVSSPVPTGCVLNGEVEDYKEPIAPTAITVSALSANVDGVSILVSWQTFNEVEMVGFNLYRADSPDGPRSLIFSTPAQFSGTPMGKVYTFSDAGVQTGMLYTYWLEIIHTTGSPTTLDPASATLGLKFYLPVIIR